MDHLKAIPFHAAEKSPDVTAPMPVSAEAKP
jgi:hypothetical protein